MAVDKSGIVDFQAQGKRVGRPAFQPTEEQRKLVRRLAGYGMPHEQIAALVGDEGIGREALTKHFAVELAQGKASANERIGATLFEKAMAGDTASLIWWTKAQMRWTSLQQIQVQSEQRISIVSALEQAEGRVIEGELVAPDAVDPDAMASGSLGMGGSIGMGGSLGMNDPVAGLVPEAAPEGLSQGLGEGLGATDAPQALDAPKGLDAPRGLDASQGLTIPQFAPRGHEGN